MSRDHDATGSGVGPGEIGVPPLPRELLPDPVGHAPPGVWERRARAILREAAPVLSGYRSRRADGSGAWWEALAAWWRPAGAGALAAAAAAVTALALLAPDAGDATGPEPALAAVVSQGDPAAVWSAAAGEADPALALIVVEGGAP